MQPHRCPTVGRGLPRSRGWTTGSGIHLKRLRAQRGRERGLPLAPISPYGVTKVAAEALVQAYVRERGLDAVILRYFSVYGPRQRPDMAYHLFCEALLDDRELTVFGDGRQSRSNTYVTDVAAATIAALTAGDPGLVANIAGGESIALLDALEVLADALGAEPRIAWQPAQVGISGTPAVTPGWRGRSWAGRRRLA